MSTENRPTVVSFFSGGLGLDCGLHQAGFQTILCHEINKAACETIRKNTDIPVCNEDLNDTLWSPDDKWRDFIAMGDAKSVDVVVGGPPCQSFSVAGKKRGLDDERGQLVFSFAEAIKRIYPRFFVMENVKGLKNALVEPGVKVIDKLVDDFIAMGYVPKWQVLNSADYGAPQSRERLILVGERVGMVTKPGSLTTDHKTHFEFPEPTHNKQTWRTLRDVLKDIDATKGAESLVFNDRQREMMSHIGEGECWSALYKLRDDALFRGDHALATYFDNLGEKNMGSIWNRDKNGSTAYWRRLAWDKPAPTLTTTPTQRGSFFAHPEQQRPLTVEEYQTIQGFPSDWELQGTTSQKYKQVGNAVPVQLGYVIGKALMDAMKKQEESANGKDE